MTFLLLLKFTWLIASAFKMAYNSLHVIAFINIFFLKKLQHQNLKSFIFTLQILVFGSGKAILNCNIYLFGTDNTKLMSLLSLRNIFTLFLTGRLTPMHWQAHSYFACKSNIFLGGIVLVNGISFNCLKANWKSVKSLKNYEWLCSRFQPQNRKWNRIHPLNKDRWPKY